MIHPINAHVQIKPISKVAEDGIMHTQEKNYDEVAVVISAEDWMDLQVGAKVFFDSWQAAKFNEDTAEEFWLVPYAAIRAYEIPE